MEIHKTFSSYFLDLSCPQRYRLVFIVFASLGVKVEQSPTESSLMKYRYPTMATDDATFEVRFETCGQFFFLLFEPRSSDLLVLQ